MPEQRGLIARLSSFVRWLLLALLVCAAGVVVGRQFLSAQLDEQIRAHVERLFAEHYRSLEVHVDAARRIEGKGIEIRGFSMRSKTGEAAYREWISVDEMFLACRADLVEVLAGTPAVRTLTLRRMKVHATCYQQGKWNIAALLPLPNFNGSVPQIVIEDSTIELQDLGKRPAGDFALREIDARLQAEAQPDGSKKWKFVGTLLGDHFKHVQVQGLTDATGAEWSAWGTIDGLEMSQRMLSALPADVAKYLSFLAALRARALFEFRVSHQRDSANPVDFLLQGHLAEGRVEDPRLPFPLSDLEADVFCDNRQLRIENVTAQSGPTTLKLSCCCDGFLSGSPKLALTAQLGHLPLDDRLYELLPENLQAEWNKFAPRGTVDVVAALTLGDNHLEPDVDIRCRDVSFSYYKFPMRLQQAQGVIHYTGNQIRIREFTATANGQTISLAAQFRDLGPQATGWLTLRSGGPIRLDDELIAAMHPTGQRIIRSLHPSGAITVVEGRVEKRAPNEPPQTRWEIQINDCSLQYDRFPYAIHNITGQLIIAGPEWEFRDLRGYHGSNYLTCQGGWTPAADGGPGGDLLLDFKCWDVPLDDSLRLALGQFSGGIQRLWDSLRPRGAVDHVLLTMRHHSRTDQTLLDLRAEKWPPSQNVPGRTIYVHPTWLPLPLEDVTGSLTFSDGRFQLHNISAVRDNSRVELEGRGQLLPQQGWEVAFSKIVADRLNVDREFLDAMPTAIRPALRQLKYAGTVSINGNGWLRGGEEIPLTAGWDLLLDMENGVLDNELRLDHIHGGVRLTGQKDARGFFSRGELEIDSLMTRDIQVTQMQGPFWLDAQQVLFGARAVPPQRSDLPRQVTAKALGGTVALDGQVLLDNELHFTADLTLSDGRVLEFARTVQATAQDITGKVYAVVHLTGARAGLHTLQGNGQVRLREADIYQLPVMTRLLSVLNLGDPDTTTFTSSDIDFRIKGEQMYLDRIDFSGDVMSLKGQGWMDLNRQINLNFYALVGRQEFQLPIVKTLLAQASRSILLIQVVGTVDQPQVIRKALPDLDETLQRIFPEAAPRTAGFESRSVRTK
ncbi:MAG: hypothetical protein ACYC0X_06125 [Pirellulaceae bacterium]